MTDLLPDEIYVCVRPSEISSRFSTLEVCRDETGIGGWPSGKYIRADLVSTPNKPAEVDLDGLRREVWDGAGLLTEQAEMHLDRILNYLASTGRIRGVETPTTNEQE